ncbi:unnamed protein product, partial [Allacma fusca]
MLTYFRTKTFTDLTIGRNVDIDKSNINSSINKPRNHRRLNKWVKSSEDTAAEDTVMESQDDSLLYQSIKTMETHLLDKGG